MSILVIGGTGFVGKNVIKRLVESGEDPIDAAQSVPGAGRIAVRRAGKCSPVLS